MFSHSVCISISFHYLCNKPFQSKYNQASCAAAASVVNVVMRLLALTECKWHPCLCSTLVLPPTHRQMQPIMLFTVPSSASNHDSLFIRSHLRSTLEEAAGVLHLDIGGITTFRNQCAHKQQHFWKIIISQNPTVLRKARHLKKKMPTF